MLIFYPTGGLANRMRVIDSAVRFGIQSKQKVKIIWVKDNGLNCSFSTIWYPVTFVKDYNWKWLPLFFSLRSKSRVFQKFLNLLEKLNLLKILGANEYDALRKLVRTERLRGYYCCLISTYSTFFSGDNFQRELFCLQPEIAKLVDKETEDFDAHTIGVHIRRTDNGEAIRNSPLELFVEKMEAELQTESYTKFYVASDSEDVKRNLKSKFGDKVILRGGGLLDRNSQEGIIQAVVEMFALSRTTKIFGSFWSSFSEMAATIGNIDIFIVKKGEQK